MWLDIPSQFQLSDAPISSIHFNVVLYLPAPRTPDPWLTAFCTSLIVHGPVYAAKNSVSSGHVSAPGIRSVVFRSVAWTELSTIALIMDDSQPTLRVMELAIKRSTFSMYGMFER